MKKIALIRIFIYIFIGDAAALKIRDITNITPTIAAWIEEYYSLEGRYPEEFEDVLKKELKVFDYDISAYYNNLKKEGYSAFVKDKTLIVIDLIDKKKCIYVFETKNLFLYDSLKLLRVFKTM